MDPKSQNVLYSLKKKHIKFYREVLWKACSKNIVGCHSSPIETFGEGVIIQCHMR